MLKHIVHLFQTPSNIAYMSTPDIVCQQARHALQGLEGDSFHDHGAGLLISCSWTRVTAVTYQELSCGA